MTHDHAPEHSVRHLATPIPGQLSAATTLPPPQAPRGYVPTHRRRPTPFTWWLVAGFIAALLLLAAAGIIAGTAFTAPG